MSNNPITFALMFFDAENFNSSEPEKIRYKIKDRPLDNIRYNYNYHDLKNFAEHYTLDPNLGVNMTNHYIKSKATKDH